MEDTQQQPGDTSTSLSTPSSAPEIITITTTGDVVLDVTFHNSKETIRSAKKQSSTNPSQPVPKSQTRKAFRVDLGTLRRQSRYFDKLLGDPHFREARAIADRFEELRLQGVARPGDAIATELPWVVIRDEDEAGTTYAWREVVFKDLLRVLHGWEGEGRESGEQNAVKGEGKEKGEGSKSEAKGQGEGGKKVTMAYVTSLAVLADRFDCAAAVSKYVATGLKFKWPITNRGSGVGRLNNTNITRDDGNNIFGGMSRANESILRQKILVSWLLNLPGKFQAATRELIMNGSCRWSSFGEEEEEEEGGKNVDGGAGATWWYLQDGLEEELQHRRASILNTLASIPRHFLRIYTTTRQCTLGYDSSVSCDAYQLGEMYKFLTKSSLIYITDFSPRSLDSLIDASLLSVDHILSTLRQCPSYQIDKNHTNCGLRTHMMPILDFVQGLLSANSISLSRTAWKISGNRAAHSWISSSSDNKPFRYTRYLAGDQRFRFENALGADKLARDVFTASSWDWTAEDLGPGQVSTTPKWSFR